MRTQKTYCRICEAHCGLEVDVGEGERIVAVRPDRTHPVSRGYACSKGTALGALHHDPDRVDHPLRRSGDGFERVSWDEALDDIGARIAALRAEHGPRSLGHYTGNPTFFSFANLLYSGALTQALGSPNLFASHSIDVNNKFHVATSMYGVSTVQPIPDFEHCRFLVYLGSNPAVSQMSVVSVPRVLERLAAIVERGGRVIGIDPRRSETAARVGEHLFIRPGTDAYLLLGMLHVLTVETPLDTAPIASHVRGLEELVAAGAAWTPERVAAVTGIGAEAIRALARDFAAADGAALYLSTGVNMGPFGSVAYWLAQALNLLTGNLDRRGGLLVPRGPANLLGLSKLLGLGSFDEHRTLAGGWHRVAGAFPVAALADEIEVEHPERIRALVVSAGNPLHSVPGGRLAKALDRLDLLVAIDIQMSETAARADYVLPATDMLERSDYPLSHAMLMARPWAQYTGAVVAPLHERRPEWWIFGEIARRAGAPWWSPTPLGALPRLNRWLERVPGLGPVTPDHLLDGILRSGGQVSLAKLRASPQGLPLAPDPPGSFLGRRVPTRDGRVDLAPPELVRDLARVERQEADFLHRDDRLAVIGRRERRSHNSWMHNNARIRHDGGIRMLMHPEDAAARGIEDGSEAWLGGEGGLRLPVEITPDVMPGVVVVPHGWGHAGSGQRKARSLPGGNVNRVLPDADRHMEPVSGQAIMLGHRLSVVAASPRHHAAGPIQPGGA